MNNNKIYAVIVAGGKGTRMGNKIPKQFLHLMGMPVLCHSILAFKHAFKQIKIILVAPEDDIDSAETILKSYIPKINVTIVNGGDTRFQSVKNGLNAISGNGIVFIHDAARPLLSQEVIQRCFECTLDNGNAVPAVPVVDSIRMIDNEGNTKPLNRDNVKVIQTPQTFRTDIIIPAFNQPYNSSFTDEATVAEATGIKIHLVDGDVDNIKITNPADLVLADIILKSSL
jgi:2-C-methyl-D-erythritol 4-phosphate cytidylyltransferase